VLAYLIVIFNRASLLSPCEETREGSCIFTNSVREKRKREEREISSRNGDRAERHAAYVYIIFLALDDDASERKRRWQASERVGRAGDCASATNNSFLVALRLRFMNERRTGTLGSPRFAPPSLSPALAPRAFSLHLSVTD